LRNRWLLGHAIVCFLVLAVGIALFGAACHLVRLALRLTAATTPVCTWGIFLIPLILPCCWPTKCNRFWRKTEGGTLLAPDETLS